MQKGNGRAYFLFPLSVKTQSAINGVLGIAAFITDLGAIVNRDWLSLLIVFILGPILFVINRLVFRFIQNRLIGGVMADIHRNEELES